MAAGPLKLVGGIARLAVRLVWTSTMILVPLFGFWLASSLAAFRNASQWLALSVGLALFPILPVAWELIDRWRRRGRATPPILTATDRLILRTLIINGVFLGGMLWRAPELGFRALAVRGDWMLDGRDDDTANQVRHVLLDLADRFERRWHKADDRYGASDAGPDSKPGAGAASDPRKAGAADPSKPAATDPTKPAGATVSTDPAKPGGATVSTDPAKPAAESPSAPDAWPLAAEPDVAVSEMPADAQASIATVGAYLAQHFTEPHQLVKAIHDYVALRLHYDYDGLALLVAHDDAHAPSQDADAVFAARAGVCAGYARLMVALGKAAGVEIAYVTGHIRDVGRRTPLEGSDDEIRAALEGYSHAWNAAKIDGQWLLVDTTWDDPKDAKEPIGSTYLFTPPALFIHDHLPNDDAWQLLPAPVSPGDFVRQPMMSPAAGALGLTLVEPTRSQVTVDGALDLVIDNPAHANVTASVRQPGSEVDRQACGVTGGAQLRVHCRIAPGQVEVWLYAAAARDTTGYLRGIGSILVNSR